MSKRRSFKKQIHMSNKARQLRRRAIHLLSVVVHMKKQKQLQFFMIVLPITAFKRLKRMEQ